MSVSRALVYEAIDSEREYQEWRWKSNPLEVGEFLALFDVYLRKAQDIWAIEEKPLPDTLEFVRKLAGIAVNCLEQHGVTPRDLLREQLKADLAHDDIVMVRSTGAFPNVPNATYENVQGIDIRDLAQNIKKAMDKHGAKIVTVVFLGKEPPLRGRIMYW